MSDFEVMPIGTAAKIAELEAALQPFADFADPHGYVPDEHKITVGSELAKRQLTMADCRKARAALPQQTRKAA